MNDTKSSQSAVTDTDAVRDILRMLKSMTADLARLLALEAKLFGHTILAMIGLTIMITLFLVGGWLYAGAALAKALANLQFFNLTGALLTVALAHLALAVLGYWRLRYITRDLTFQESRTSASNLLAHARAYAAEAKEQQPEEK